MKSAQNTENVDEHHIWLTPKTRIMGNGLLLS